jgi:hypothetical protein
MPILMFSAVAIFLSVKDKLLFAFFFIFPICFYRYKTLLISRAFMQYHPLIPITVCNMKCVVYRNIFGVILIGFRMVKLTFFC